MTKPVILFIIPEAYCEQQAAIYQGFRKLLGPDGVIEYPRHPLYHCTTREQLTIPRRRKVAPRALLMDPIPYRSYDEDEIWELVPHARCIGVKFGMDTPDILAVISRLMPIKNRPPTFIWAPWNGWETEHIRDRVRSIFELIDDQVVFFKGEVTRHPDIGSGRVYDLLPSGREFLPLPVAVYEGLDPQTSDYIPTGSNQTYSVFWVGFGRTNKRIGITRFLASLDIEGKLIRYVGTQVGEPRVDFFEFMRLLSESKIGIATEGQAGGEDFRYTEVPAAGAMLLALRHDRIIPHDFTEGVNAEFFSSHEELKEKILYYLDHDDKRRQIAEAGRQHCLKYHTATARAKYILEVMEGSL